MIDKLNNDQVSEGALNTRRGVLGAAQIVNQSTTNETNAQNGSESTQDASLHVTLDSLIEQAKCPPTQYGSEVARAKAMIESGELDTPINILKATKNIVECGF